MILLLKDELITGTGFKVGDWIGVDKGVEWGDVEILKIVGCEDDDKDNNDEWLLEFDIVEIFKFGEFGLDLLFELSSSILVDCIIVDKEIEEFVGNLEYELSLESGNIDLTLNEDAKVVDEEDLPNDSKEFVLFVLEEAKDLTKLSLLLGKFE